MYDIDQEAIEMGGVASFFIGEFEKYSWKHLFDPKLSGVDKVKLYSDAIQRCIHILLHHHYFEICLKIHFFHLMILQLLICF